MSVFVKDMKMPKGCHSGCPLTDSDAFTCQITGKDIVIYDEDTITSRPSWCPLVEVPTPHGRLIDSEEFNNMLTLGVMTAQMLGSDENTSLDIHFMKEILKEMPTVIEAEE